MKLLDFDMYFQFANCRQTRRDFHAVEHLLILVAFVVESLSQRHCRHLAKSIVYSQFTIHIGPVNPVLYTI